MWNLSLLGMEPHAPSASEAWSLKLDHEGRPLRLPVLAESAAECLLCARLMLSPLGRTVAQETCYKMPVLKCRRSREVRRPV